jgi:hypothetical protein
VLVRNTYVELLLMKPIIAKTITISTFARSIVVVGITKALHYLAHTSTSFLKKAKSSLEHTHYTPKPLWMHVFLIF